MSPFSASSHRVAGIAAVKPARPASGTTQPVQQLLLPFKTGRSTTLWTDPAGPAAGGHACRQLLRHTQQWGWSPHGHTTSGHPQVDHPRDPFHHRDDTSLDVHLRTVGGKTTQPTRNQFLILRCSKLFFFFPFLFCFVLFVYRRTILFQYFQQERT